MEPQDQLIDHRRSPGISAKRPAPPAERPVRADSGGGVRRQVEDLLALADIRVGGDRPGDIHVHDEAFFSRVLAEHSLGLGESYMDGWWDCDELDVFFFKLTRARLDEQVRISRRILWNQVRASLINRQRRRKAFEVGRRHYDLGNDLFERMLDRRMQYSCGYWRSAGSLDEAQEAKLDLICRKMMLEPGMRMLDTGCGWGGLAQYAAEKYGVDVVGITVSREQEKLARERCAGLPVEIRFQDYRDVRETFDRVVSVGMFEHVGVKNHRGYLERVRQCLAPDGLFLLHTIGSEKSRVTENAWLDRYIFPNGLVPSAAQITKAAEGLFVLEDWHAFGQDYDRTLMAWHRNFTANWEPLRDRYGERFYRMWTYFLLSCAGSFRSRSGQLWQIVFSKTGVLGGYASVR
jgi:cyclopropane-fatty-acyl-phospholipid synthase